MCLLESNTITINPSKKESNTIKNGPPSISLTSEQTWWQEPAKHSSSKPLIFLDHITQPQKLMVRLSSGRPTNSAALNT